MRGGVLQLQRWGLLPALREAGTPPLRSTSFHYGEHVVDLPIKPREGVDALYAPRRFVLDAALAEAARAAGADVIYGARVLDVLRDHRDRVRGVVLLEGPRRVVRVEAELVVGADGANSRIARGVGAETYREGSHSSGVVYGYWSGLSRGSNQWYFGEGTGAGAISTNDGVACVFTSVPAERFEREIRRDLALGHRRVLGECAGDLLEAVNLGRICGGLRGFAGRLGYLRRSWGPGWALVGDAGYFKDPITAHGITDALRDAELLVRAFVGLGESGLAEYQAERDELALPLFQLSDEIASYAWSLERVQVLHLALSREMNREFAAMVELHQKPAPSMRRTA
jgi:2-polyprenyl-6-methoxyphenol hydroxylase-like FAD-dependent oxidoreductase